MSLHGLGRGTPEPAWSCAQACASLPMHVYAHSSEHEAVCAHMWTHLGLFMCQASTVHVQPRMYIHQTRRYACASYYSHLPIPGSDDWDGEGRGRGGLPSTPSIKSPAP